MMDLGSCCGCGTSENVNNILNLPFKASMKRTGWGCVVCGLPPDGAIAVLCNDCSTKLDIVPMMVLIRWVCYGIPSRNKRIRFDLGMESHGHSYENHQHEPRSKFDAMAEIPISNPSMIWFVGSPDSGHPDCICSNCQKRIPSEVMPMRIWNGVLEARFCNDCISV